MTIAEQVKAKIARVYYNHGLFCATHPTQLIVSVCVTVVILCIPLTQFPFTKDVPLDHIVLREDEFQTFKNSHLLYQSYGNPNRSLGYSLQIVFHSKVITHSGVSCVPVVRPLVDVLLQSLALFRMIREFRSVDPKLVSQTAAFEDLCYQVEDRVIVDAGNTDSVYNALPTFSCLLLGPSLLWDNNPDEIKTSHAKLFAKLRQAAAGNLRDVLFGLPWQLTGIRRGPLCGPAERNTMAFVITLVFRDYNPMFVDQLREYLHSRFPVSTNHTTPNESARAGSGINPDPRIKSEPAQVYLVWYRGRSYLSDYAPLIFIYVILLLYVYFSVCKLEMVKSKWGLAFSACFTVVASLCMSMGLCLSIGLMVPTLNGSEVFPYLVVLIGFENVIILTKSVVATPVDLPVKYRIAEGLSKESWPLTKHFCTQLALLGLGFFTFHPTMQEFCLFAVIGVTTDFFLQLFFFVTVLSVDIRRMELSDLSKQLSRVPILPSSDRAPVICAVPSSSDTRIESASDVASTLTTACEPTLEQLIPCVRLCCSCLSKLMFPLRPLLRFFSKIGLSRSPIGPFHKRNVSAAEAAAFLSSDAKPDERVPRRLWLLRIWAKHRLVQRLFMLIIALWITVIVAYTFDLTVFQPKRPSLSSTGGVTSSDPDSPVSASESSPTMQVSVNPNTTSNSFDWSDDSSSISSAVHGLEQILRRLDATGKRKNGELRSHPFITSPESTWDEQLLWNYLSFFQWPLIANYYNMTLAGYHLTILEPIHLVYEIRPSSNSLDLADEDGHLSLKPTSYGASEYDTERRKLDWNWVSYTSLQEWWAHAYRAFEQADVQPSLMEADSASESHRFVGFSEELLEYVRESKPRPVSSVSPGGIAGWTARLWLTATMLGTSFLGCSCVLLVTCLGMICFQELQSKSSAPSNREPVIRVLPLTISLKVAATIHEQHDTGAALSGADWTIACGKIRRFGAHGASTTEGAIAACYVAPATDLCAPFTNIIHLWCTSSGLMLPPIQRYSEEAVLFRQSVSTHPGCVVRKHSTVWCMGFSKLGSLIIGCSDGTIEVWNCGSNRLERVLSLLSTSQNGASDISQFGNAQFRSAHPGGITVINMIGEHCFAVGTSRGYTAWFSLDTAHLEGATGRGICQWHMHTRAITQITHAHYTELHNALEEQVSDRNRFLLVSCADDGLVCFYDSSSSEPIYHVSADNNAILSFDFSHLMLAVSHASRSLRVFQFNLRMADGLPKLESNTEGIELSQMEKSRSVGERSHIGYVGLKWFTTSRAVQSKDGTFSPSLSEFRLVTAQLDSTVAIWMLKPTIRIVRTFRANLSSLSPCNPLVSVGNRVIFGDQGYLRVVNPWTAKYERSVHLLPPSTVSIESNGTARCATLLTTKVLRQWSKELIPIGVAGAYDLGVCKNNTGSATDPFSGSMMVSVADEGQTLVVIPLTTVKTVWA